MMLDNPIFLFVFIMLIAYLILRFLAERLKRKPEKWEIPKIKVVAKCEKCNELEQISYESGYTIGQTLTELCDCGGERYIERIYCDEKTEKEKKWQDYTKLFR